jgi:hypothetical protein
MGMQHIIPLPFNSIFPGEEPEELSQYLSGINKEFLKKTGAFFLGFSNKDSAWSNPKDFVQKFFSQGNEKFANEVLEKINGLEDGKYSIPYEISSLKLFEYVFDTDIIQGKKPSEEEQEINIFKAYLLLNQLNTEANGIITTKSLVDVSADRKPAAALIANHFHNFDLTNYDLDKLFATQLIKSISFFEFLEGIPEAKALLDEFYRTFNVNGYKDFLKRLIPISASIAMKEKESYTDIDIAQNQDLKSNVAFLEKLAVNDTDKVEDLDFKGLRSRPLYKASENVYRIISPLFALELLFNGLYWKLKEVNDNLPDGDKIKGFNVLKTARFSEVHLLHKVLKKYFGNRYIQYSGEELDAIYNGAPDYYVRNGKRVFLFESKDILPTAEVKESTDFLKIEKLLSDKLYKPKGIMQLISNIRLTLKNEQPFDKGVNKNTVIIYPVMVIHQRLFMIAGVNKLLNLWLQDELKVLQSEGLDVSRVRSLVLIDIDTLIFNQDVFEKRKLDFEDCIVEYNNAYLNFITKGGKYRSEQDAIAALKDSYLPFSYYLDSKVDKLKWRNIPSELMEKGYKLFG